MKQQNVISVCLVLFFGLSSLAQWPPLTKEQLGERLFFDPILSLDSTLSCASCHNPDFAFADTAQFSTGVGGRLGKRNSPSVTNMTARPYFFYDGRAPSLEHQIFMPVTDTLEMRATPDLIIGRLQAHPEYRTLFSELYGHAPDVAAVSDAVAAYIRTLETGDSPFDRWMRGRENPMGEQAVRGRRIFMKKGKCFDCHFSPDFTGDEFRNIGLYNGKNLQDAGRFLVTRDSADLGKFKVPGLRNVAVTPPYMHNGMFKTLEEVIDFYDQPDQFVPDAINRDPLMAQPLGLTPEEKQDLKAFLEALTDERWRN